MAKAMELDDQVDKVINSLKRKRDLKEQGSEVPSLGTFSGTLSGKWAKVGKMGENGGK